MKLIQLCILCLLLHTAGVSAASETHTQAAIKLLEVTQSQSLTDGMVNEMKQLLSDIPVADDLTIEQQRLFEAFQIRMYLLIDTRLSWDTLKSEYANIYTESYTEEELNQLISFYESPLGKKLLANSATINAALADIPQHNLNILMSEMQTAAQTVTQEINQLKQKATDDNFSKTD